MELSDFANKKFAIYGLGFHGDNIKVFGDIKYPLDIATIEGYNLLNHKKWGKYIVRYTFGGPVISYNLPNNHWHKKYFPNIRKLVDKDFHKVRIMGLGDNCQIAQETRDDQCGIYVIQAENEYLKSILGHFEKNIPEYIIEGTAYWCKFRVGNFWMAEIASTAVDITYESKPKWIEVRKEVQWAKKWL